MTGARYALEFPSNRLFVHALRILDDAGARYGRPFDWTLGGGTVLALRHRHRSSKDIDIFLPDPQYLGYVNPQLSDAAAQDDPDYEVAAEFIKLRYPEGEVDFVAGPVLTDPGAEAALVDGRLVQLETDIEIVAKKLYFRGDRFMARDLFDLAMLLQAEPASVIQLAPWAQKHRASLSALITQGAGALRAGFEAIDSRGPRPTLQAALDAVQPLLSEASRIHEGDPSDAGAVP